jgi:hypothetical protein
MSRKGIKNKRTLIREQRMIEAARNAARAADGSTDGGVLLDCLDVMEAGMRYFFGRFQTENAEKKPDWDTADSALLHAVAIAKDITPYRHPRLTTMKVSHDPNADPPLDDLTREELRQQIDRHLEELGLFLTTERPADPNRGNGSVS